MALEHKRESAERAPSLHQRFKEALSELHEEGTFRNLAILAREGLLFVRRSDGSFSPVLFLHPLDPVDYPYDVDEDAAPYQVHFYDERSESMMHKPLYSACADEIIFARQKAVEAMSPEALAQNRQNQATVLAIQAHLVREGWSPGEIRTLKGVSEGHLVELRVGLVNRENTYEIYIDGDLAFATNGSGGSLLKAMRHPYPAQPEELQRLFSQLDIDEDAYNVMLEMRNVPRDLEWFDDDEEGVEKITARLLQRIRSGHFGRADRMRYEKMTPEAAAVFRGAVDDAIDAIPAEERTMEFPFWRRFQRAKEHFDKDYAVHRDFRTGEEEA